jgi:hypothetical protein
VGTVLSTQSVLIANPQTEHTELVEVVRRRIAGERRETDSSGEREV